MKKLSGIIAVAALAAVLIGGATGCRKKVYLEQPTPKPGVEKPNNERVGETDRREPYVVDMPIDRVDGDYIIEEVPADN